MAKPGRKKAGAIGSKLEPEQSSSTSSAPRARYEAARAEQSQPASMSTREPGPVPVPKAPKTEIKREDDHHAAALGYLMVNGRQPVPVYSVIPGYEDLFEPRQEQRPQTSTTKSEVKTPQATDSQVPRNTCTASKSSRVAGKRRRQIEISDDESEGDVPGKKDKRRPAIKCDQTSHNLHIGDIDDLKHFYGVRLQELTMKPLRDIVTAWVKRLEPKRQKKYGPYLRFKSTRSFPTTAMSRSRCPPWWPAEVPYIEPSHLKLRHIIPLAVDIMLIHRNIDEQCGKRNHPSWIYKLQQDAVYCVSSKDTDQFSSSRGGPYNVVMKTRALEVILPSLFEVAIAHEEHVAAYNLYESSGIKDPGHGKQIFWSHIDLPAPDRQTHWKKKRARKTVTEPANEAAKMDSGISDDSGEDTEVDHQADDESSTAFSSFQSTVLDASEKNAHSQQSTGFSYYFPDEDVKMFPGDDVANTSDQSLLGPANVYEPYNRASALPSQPYFDAPDPLVQHFAPGAVSQSMTWPQTYGDQSAFTSPTLGSDATSLVGYGPAQTSDMASTSCANNFGAPNAGYPSDAKPVRDEGKLAMYGRAISEAEQASLGPAAPHVFSAMPSGTVASYGLSTTWDPRSAF